MLGLLSLLLLCPARAADTLMATRQVQMFRPAIWREWDAVEFYSIRGRWMPARRSDAMPEYKKTAYVTTLKHATAMAKHFEKLGYQRGETPIPVLLEFVSGRGAGSALPGHRIHLPVGPQLRRDLANATAHETTHVVLRLMMAEIPGHPLGRMRRGYQADAVNEGLADYFAAGSTGRYLSFRDIRTPPKTAKEYPVHALGHVFANALWQARAALLARGWTKVEIDRAVIAALKDGPLAAFAENFQTRIAGSGLDVGGFFRRFLRLSRPS